MLGFFSGWVFGVWGFFAGDGWGCVFGFVLVLSFFVVGGGRVVLLFFFVGLFCFFFLHRES